jgi:hypothetical protein
VSESGRHVIAFTLEKANLTFEKANLTFEKAKLAFRKANLAFAIAGQEFCPCPKATVFLPVDKSGLCKRRHFSRRNGAF